MVRPFTHDLYAPLAHKEALGDGDGQTLPAGFGSSSYLPYDDARRLTAYRIMAAMRDNVARYYLPEAMWTRDRVTGTELDRVRQLLASADGVAAAEKQREYGDPALLVAQGRSLMLGDSQDLVLPELVELLNEAKDRPDAGETETPATEQARLEAWNDWLGGWADAERLGLALLEGEESTVGDGDGVYALGWSERLGRPRLRVYDPGWYFPDLSTIGDDEEYPTVVHAAWEETRGQRVFLHRKTWRLIPAETPYAVPWSDKKADRTCTYEVGEWDITKIGQTEDIYTLGKPTTAILAPTDLRIDFLPVVHVPNDAAGKRHFGRSLILLVAQLLDDIASTDTDLAANSELVGSTPLVTKGAGTPALGAGPGAQWNLPAGADAKLLDTSKALTGLIELDEHLLDRLSVNTRLAAALLGRVKPNEVPSGFALELGFAPTRSLIREMRMVRDAKHPLLLKFAMRIAQVNDPGGMPKGETPRAEIALGGFLPADKAAAVEQVTKLLKDHAISRPTAVQILIQADFPIDDAELEVERIAKEAFDDMVKLVEATGDEAEARRRLGIAALPTPPVPDLPTPPVADGATE